MHFYVKMTCVTKSHELGQIVLPNLLGVLYKGKTYFTFNIVVFTSYINRGGFPIRHCSQGSKIWRGVAIFVVSLKYIKRKKRIGILITLYLRERSSHMCCLCLINVDHLSHIL